MKTYKSSDAPVIGALNIIREKTGWQLIQSFMVYYAFTTDPLAGARFIGTIAGFLIVCFIAIFHPIFSYVF